MIFIYITKWSFYSFRFVFLVKRIFRCILLATFKYITRSYYSHCVVPQMPRIYFFTGLLYLLTRLPISAILKLLDFRTASQSHLWLKSFSNLEMFGICTVNKEVGIEIENYPKALPLIVHLISMANIIFNQVVWLLVFFFLSLLAFFVF